MAVSPQPSRNAPLAITAVLVLAAIALVVVGVIYFKDTAGALPSFFPGHQAGSAHKHIKHGAGALVLAAVCLVGAWFSTGTSRT